MGRTADCDRNIGVVIKVVQLTLNHRMRAVACTHQPLNHCMYGTGVRPNGWPSGSTARTQSPHGITVRTAQGVELNGWPSGPVHHGVRWSTWHRITARTAQKSARPSGWPLDSAARTHPPWGCQSWRGGQGAAVEALAGAAGSAGDEHAHGVGRGVPRTPWQSPPADPRRPHYSHPASSACPNARAACLALE